jgi:hypothetical protein
MNQKRFNLPTVFTEAEAGSRMCPMSANRQPEPFNCKGSECAAWRWYSWNKSTWGPGPSAPVGYCGLAEEIGSPLAPATQSKQESKDYL